MVVVIRMVIGVVLYLKVMMLLVVIVVFSVLKL